MSFHSSSSAKNNDLSALDLFLTNIARDSARDANEIIQMGINITSIKNTKMPKYQLKILKELDNYPAPNSNFYLSLPTFVSFASANPSLVLNQMSTFFPKFTDSSNPKDIFSFFPKVPVNEESLIYFLLSYFSDIIFLKLASICLKSHKEKSNSMIEWILHRCFNHPLPLPETATFQHQIYLLMLRKQKETVNYICEHGFFDIFAEKFNFYFQQYFNHPQLLIFYLKSAENIVYNESNFSLIKDTLQQFLKIFDYHSKSPETIDSLCNSLCCIIPQMNKFVDMEYIHKIEKKIEPYIKRLKSSVSRLYGIFHYFQFTQTSKQIKLFERFFVKRMKKPQKVFMALDYISNILQPSNNLPFNSNQDVLSLLNDISTTLLETPIRNNTDENFSTVFLKLAYYDFKKFVTQWLPILFKGNEHQKHVAFLTSEKILNPLYQYQLTIPTEYRNNILKQISQFTSSFFEDVSASSDFALHFESVTNILSKFDVPVELKESNNLKIPTNVLYFLIHLTAVNPLENPKLKIIDRFKNSEKVCEDSLNQIREKIDPIHSSYGQLMEKVNLNFGKNTKTKHNVFLLPFLQTLPILFHFSNNPNEYTKPLLLLMICDDVQIALLASLVFELLLIGFPNYSAFFINELVQLVKNEGDLQSPQLYRIYLVYLHSINLSKSHLSNSSDLIQEFSDYIVFNGFCSQYPETRLLAYEILQSSFEFYQNKQKTLKKFLEKKSDIISQKAFVSLISEYSMIKVSCSEFQSISFVDAVGSPFFLLWKFYFRSMSNELIYNSETLPLVISARDSFIDHVNITKGSISDFYEYDVQLNSMKLLFLFLSSTSNISVNLANLRKTWLKQQLVINEMIECFIASLSQLAINDLYHLTFDFASLHPDSIPNSLTVFLSIPHNNCLLTVLATLLRRISVQSYFESQLNEMINNQQITTLLSLFDKILLYVISDSFDTGTQTIAQASKSKEKGNKKLSRNKSKEEMPKQVENMQEKSKVDDIQNLLANFLIFRGSFYKYLYQTRPAKPLGPIPRCAICVPIDKELCSPIVNRHALFEIMFRCALTETIAIRNASIYALTYLIALGPIFHDDKSFSPLFFSYCSNISKIYPSFLKFLLSSHINLLLSKFLMFALTLPSIEESTVYLHAISAQFVPYGKNCSFVISPELFLCDHVNDGDPNLVHLIYSETGTFLLVGLIYLMHINIETRQASMRMLTQLTPIILLLNGQKEGSQQLLALMKQLKKLVTVISSDSESIRLHFAINLSSSFASIFDFATEQVIEMALSALPAIWQARKYCRRDQIINLLAPWMNNIVFDLKNRVIMKNPSKYFVRYTPYSFVNCLCECVNQTESNTEDANIESSMFNLFSAIILKNNTNKLDSFNVSFLALAISDIASSKPLLRKLAVKIMTFLYRQSSKTINFVIPLLSCSNWFFHHVQLGRFEEISDMSDYLKNGIGKRIQIDFSDVHSKCNESVDFALDALENFLLEDVIPFTHEFLCIILSYCLTHINNKKAFNLIHVLAQVLKSSFDSGLPAVLRDVCEFLDRIALIPFESLRFIFTKSEDPPLRLLQSRTVLVPTILDLFIKIFDYIPTDNEKNLERELLIWGLSCGDLHIAAKALDLFVLNFASTETVIISHLIENMCIVLRCWMTSPFDDQTTNHSAEYIISSLRMIKSSCKVLKEKNKLQHYSIFYWITLSILSIKGNIYPIILEDALLLMTELINNRIFEKTSPFSGDFKDFESLLIPIALNCRNLQVMFNFVTSLVLKAPKELLSASNDFTLYLIILAPLISVSLEATSYLSDVEFVSHFQSVMKKLSELYAVTHIATLLTQILKMEFNFTNQEFSFNLIHTLNSLTTAEKLEQSALLLSGVIKNSHTFRIDPCFELASALLSVVPSQKMIENLSPLTVEATLNHFSETSAAKIRYWQAISNFSQPASFTKAMDSVSLNIELQMQWEPVLVLIQSFVSKKLHQFFKETENVVKVRFDSIDTFPPIFPLEENFLHCECFSDVMTFCRKIHVNPQSNWAYSLYCAKEMTNIKATSSDLPDLNFDVEFDKEIIKVTKQIEPKLGSNKSSIDIDSEQLNDQNDQKKTSEEVETFSEEKNMIDDVQPIVENVIYTKGECESLTYFVKIDAFLP